MQVTLVSLPIRLSGTLTTVKLSLVGLKKKTSFKFENCIPVKLKRFYGSNHVLKGTFSG